MTDKKSAIENMLGEKVFDANDLTEALQLSLRSISRYLNDGRLIGQKVGKRWYVTETNLKRFLTGAKD